MNIKDVIIYGYEEPDHEGEECPMCKGHGKYLGTLGRFVWFRCESCGWEFYITDEEDE